MTTLYCIVTGQTFGFTFACISLNADFIDLSPRRVDNAVPLSDTEMFHWLQTTLFESIVVLEIY